MKYLYAYKTADGVRHEDSMNASSREEVFSSLRARGIKAIKVVAADGSKANGEVRGVRKRVVVILLAAVALAVGVCSYFGGIRSAAQPQTGNPDKISPRHQIYGDPVLMERLERGDFADVLPREGDRLLARYAQPGRWMVPAGPNSHRISNTALSGFISYAKDELDVSADLELTESEPREIRELKQIINGMREELRGYLANGNGTPKSYLRRLQERTTQEAQIYERVKGELSREKNGQVWERQNAALRRMGLRTIPMPEE